MLILITYTIIFLFQSANIERKVEYYFKVRLFLGRFLISFKVRIRIILTRIRDP